MSLTAQSRTVCEKFSPLCWLLRLLQAIDRRTYLQIVTKIAFVQSDEVGALVGMLCDDPFVHSKDELCILHFSTGSVLPKPPPGGVHL